MTPTFSFLTLQNFFIHKKLCDTPEEEGKTEKAEYVSLTDTSLSNNSRCKKAHQDFWFFPFDLTCTGDKVMTVTVVDPEFSSGALGLFAHQFLYVKPFDLYIDTDITLEIVLIRRFFF